MMNVLILAFVLLATSASAQTVVADRILLKTGPCVERSGSGSPEGAVTGNVCDTWHQTNTPYDLWRKTSGTGTTGWVKITTGTGGVVGGTGTSGNLAQWTATDTLGNGPVASNVPLLNAVNTFTANQLITGTNWPQLTIRSTTANGGLLQLESSTSNWQIYNATNTLTVFSSAGTIPLTITSPGILTVIGATASLVMNRTSAGAGVYAGLGFQTATVAKSFIGRGFYTTNDTRLELGDINAPILAVHDAGGVSIGDVTDPGDNNLRVAGTSAVIGTGTFSANVMPALGYTSNLGSLQTKYLTLHAAELWVETLVAQNTLATIGGRVLVAPTNILSADLASAATGMTVKYNNLTSGDRVYLEADGKVEFIAIGTFIGGSAGFYSYNITRNLDASGANDWFAGDAVLNTGQTGNGFIDLYSVRGIRAATEVGPTIVGNVRNSATYNDWSPRWAIGNLDGLYGYSGSAYGVAMGDAAATNITIDATNGFRIRSGTTNKFVADTSGNLSLVGNLSIGTAGNLSSGATAYGTGTGYWLAYNAGTPQFRVGTTAGNRLSWDGTTLTLKSQNLTIDSTGVILEPGTSSAWWSDSAYRWNVPTGDLGLTGWDSATGFRGMFLRSTWTGANSGFQQVGISASHAPTSGDTTAHSASVNLAAAATGSGGSSVNITADNTYFNGTSTNVSSGGFLVTGTSTLGVLNAGTTTVTGTLNVTSTVTASNLLSGTYTPTLTGVANVATATAYACQYQRVGTAVTGACQLDVDPTATATLTVVAISLPIASAFTGAGDGSGAGGSYGTVAAQGGAVYGDATSDRLEYAFFASNAANSFHTISFTYLVR